MERLTVLVTGAGAVLGQGILRSLRMSERSVRIITVDPDFRAAGHWLGDCAYTIPKAADPEFLSRLEEIIGQEKVNVLFVGTDVELHVLSRERKRLEALYGAQIVVSSTDVIEIADDKWLTSRFLENEGFPFVRSALQEDWESVQRLVDSIGFPLLVKPRVGARSVGVQIIENGEDLKVICSKQTGLVVQELLSEDQGEFTSGCLVSDGECKAVVTLRRDLRDGNTYRAYSETTGKYDNRLIEIAERLKPDGPCNFQYRIRNGEPVIFEINARFSGTTPLRAIFGFNEVDALLNHLVDGTPIPKAVIREGAVLKAWSDVFVSQGQLQELDKSGKLSNPTCQTYPFILA